MMDKDEEGLFEVESIVDTRTYKGKVQYRVRWANYSAAHDTWEPVENLASCDDLIEIFMTEHKQRAVINGNNNAGRRKSKKSPSFSDSSSPNAQNKTPNVLEVSLDCSQEDPLLLSTIAVPQSPTGIASPKSKNSTKETSVRATNGDANLKSDLPDYRISPQSSAAGFSDSQLLIVENSDALTVRSLRKRQITISPNHSPVKRRTRKMMCTSNASNSINSSCSDLLNDNDNNLTNQLNEDNYIDLKPASDAALDSIDNEMMQLNRVLDQIRQSTASKSNGCSDAPKSTNASEIFIEHQVNNSDSFDAVSPISDQSFCLNNVSCEDECTNIIASASKVNDSDGLLYSDSNSVPTSRNLVDLVVDSVLRRTIDKPSSCNNDINDYNDLRHSVITNLSDSIHITPKNAFKSESDNTKFSDDEHNSSSYKGCVHTETSTVVMDEDAGSIPPILDSYQPASSSAISIDQNEASQTIPRLEANVAITSCPTKVTETAVQPVNKTGLPRTLKPLFGRWLPLLARQSSPQNDKLDQLKVVEDLETVIHPLEMILSPSNERSKSSSSSSPQLSKSSDSESSAEFGGLATSKDDSPEATSQVSDEKNNDDFTLLAKSKAVQERSIVSPEMGSQVCSTESSTISAAQETSSKDCISESSTSSAAPETSSETRLTEPSTSVAALETSSETFVTKPSTSSAAQETSSEVCAAEPSTWSAFNSKCISSSESTNSSSKSDERFYSAPKSKQVTSRLIPSLPPPLPEERAQQTPAAVETTQKKIFIDGISLELETRLALNDFFKLNMQQNQMDDRAESHLPAPADFYEACRLGHFDIVRSALCAAKNSKYSYDVNVLTGDGNTLLMAVVLNKCDSWHQFDDILELLVQNQANINMCNKNGDSALMLAIEGEHLCKVSKLLSLGAAVNLPNQAGETPLMVACKKGLGGVASRLLEFGADFNATTNSGATASSLATNQSIVKMLHAHDRKVKQTFDRALDAVLTPDKLRVGQVLFPMHCYALNESKAFRLMFVHSATVMAAHWSHQAVLAVAVGRFGAPMAAYYARLWGHSPVRRVLLNSREQASVQEDQRFLFAFSPLKNGVNELMIHCADDHRLSECKLLIQAFVVNRK